TRFMILSDIKTAFLAMGSSVDLKSKEGLALLLVTNALNSNEDVEFGMLNHVTEETIKPAEDLLNGSYKIFNKEADATKLVFADLIQNFDKDAKLQYLIVLYRFLSVAAKADDIVTEQETNYLKQILTRARSIDNNVEVEKDIVATLNVTFEMIHAGKSDEYDVGKYIVRSQKCVISDIQAELNISRARVLSALKTLERVGIIEAEGNKRKVLITREGDVIRLLRGQVALGDNNEDDHVETPIITTKLPIVHTEEQEDIKLPESLGLDSLIFEVAKFVVAEQEGSVAAIQRKYEIGYNRAGKISDQLESLGIYGPNRGPQGHEVLVKDLKQLDDLLSRAGGYKPKSSRAKTKSPANELDSLIGLNSVKKEVQTLTNFIKIQQKRAEQGLKSSSVSYHCVFTGNPGTGKTTVARIVADIYKELGVLKKGHLVETDRAGLVAEYVGQTAVKTNKIIDSALDGVLFIDEAYSLVGGGESDYGKEAVATLLKRMEDDRERLVVILAGYTKDMKQFIDSNPGLQSRFNRYIEFPDYTPDELYQIFALSLKKYDYHVTDDAKVALQHFFEDAVAHKDANFGNGRFVRNIFEKVLEHQANRLASESNLTTERLSEITIEDLP
ncbi:MAG: DNA translocase FtsK, partial [Sodaliphilus sp.]|nr:DNA translocase FtsK [Sodaliphilus sp.]